MSWLLDTSVIARLAVPAVRAGVEQLALDHARLARASITDLEIGLSARSATEIDELVGALSAFERIEIEPSHFRRAQHVQRMLAERGLRGRKVPELLIAAAAEAHTMTVVHYDRDFEHIATVTGQPASWIAPPGSVD